MTTDIEDRVKRCIAIVLCIPESGISNGAAFTHDLAADSLDVVEVIMSIEDEFAIEIPDGESEMLLTVQQAIDYVARRVSETV